MDHATILGMYKSEYQYGHMMQTHMTNLKCKMVVAAQRASIAAQFCC